MRKTNKYILYFLSLSFIFSVAIYFSIPSKSYIYSKNVINKDVLFSHKYVLLDKNLYTRQNKDETLSGIAQQINYFKYQNHRYKLFIFIHSLKKLSISNKELVEFQFRLQNKTAKRNKDYINAYFLEPSRTGEIFEETFKFNEFDITMKLVRLKEKENLKMNAILSITGFRNQINLKKTVNYKYTNKNYLKDYMLINYDKNSKQYYIPNNFKKELF